jgi:tetratricopeptide (TPR) repeat protein
MQSLNNLALTYFESGHSADAGKIMERALKIGEKGVRTEHASYGALLLNYAAYLRKTGRKSEAKEFEQRGKGVIADAYRRNGVGQTIDISSFRAR